MSDTPVTDADIDTAIEGAERYLMLDDHQAAYDVLEPIHASGQVQGERLGRVSFALGEACLGLDGLDAAMYYFEEAAAHAASDLRQRATERIRELERRDDAVDASSDGVAGEGEADAVLAAGDDALARGDYDTAMQQYSSAYDGIQMSRVQISRASVGLAICHLHLGEADMAEGYLQVAESNDASALTDQITATRARIELLHAGDQAAEDGVDRSELDELNRAGLAAVDSSDWESAYRYFLQMYESGQLSGTDRGRVAHNLGVSCLKSHDYDAAHQYLTEAAGTARSEIADRARSILADLEGMDEANDVAARIEAATDVFESD